MLQEHGVLVARQLPREIDHVRVDTTHPVNGQHSSGGAGNKVTGLHIVRQCLLKFPDFLDHILQNEFCRVKIRKFKIIIKKHFYHHLPVKPLYHREPMKGADHVQGQTGLAFQGEVRHR